MLLLLASAASAADPNKALVVAEPASKLAETPPFYWYTHKTPGIVQAINRTSLDRGSDINQIAQVCLIPPAADWVVAGAPVDVQVKYLDLLWAAAYADNSMRKLWTHGDSTTGTCGVRGYHQYTDPASLHRVFNGQDKKLTEHLGFQSCFSSMKNAKFPTVLYANTAASPTNVSKAIIESVNLLLKSRDPKVLGRALESASVIRSVDSFRDSIEAVIGDESITGTIELKPEHWVHETIPLRVYAMRTLATTDRTERTAKVLAKVWTNRKESDVIREGAIRAFSFVYQWPAGLKYSKDPVEGAELAKANAALRDDMRKKLYPFLIGLMTINGLANDEKEDKGLKQISDLGSAAYCAGDLWPPDARAAAKKGEKWTPAPPKKKP